MPYQLIVDVFREISVSFSNFYPKESRLAENHETISNSHFILRTSMECVEHVHSRYPWPPADLVHIRWVGLLIQEFHIFSAVCIIRKGLYSLSDTTPYRDVF